MTFDAVILAAGAGTRFGGPKLLAPYAGRPLIVHAVEAAFAAPVRWVSMVVGECAMVAWPALEWASDQGVGFSFIGGDHSEGMAASLRTGLSVLPPDCDGVFVFLGDMPRIPHAVLPLLAAAVEAGALAAAPVHAGRRGHPVVLSRSLFPRVMALTGDRGARVVLDTLGPALALVPVDDDGVLFDVDRPADLERL